MVAPSVLEQADEHVQTAVAECRFTKAGRTAWVPIGRGSLKLKGVGLYAGGATANPPSVAAFTRPGSHIGIT